MGEYNIYVSSGSEDDNVYLEWTAKVPTQAGWYWVWSKHYPDTVFMMQHGERDTDGPGFFEQDAWLGPLPEPEPPKG